jgi:ABC-2 type transport system permease protein
MQNVMVRGQGPASVLPSLLVLLGFAAVMSFLATRLFKWDEI